MFGAVPGTFKNLEACKIVASGYQLETGIDFCVVSKKVCFVERNGICQHIDLSCKDCPNRTSESEESICYYEACAIEDLYQARKDGFERVEFATTGEKK